MKFKTFLIKGCSKAYKTIFRPTYYACSEGTVWQRQDANDLLYSELSKGEPYMLTRYGSIEMSVTNTWRVKESKRNYLLKLWDYVVDRTDLPWIDDIFWVPINRNAGVFNPTPEILERFAKTYLEDSKIIDMLMSVNYKEKFMPLKSDCKFIHFESIYPYFVERPWTRILKGKKVLVIHPYADTIKKQYAKRELLYDNPDILPEFELVTLKAVQSSAYEEVPFKDWFEALEYMKNQMDNIDYDICLLGCGAYGLPLAAHAKRLGKQALHIGGGIQLLFGIKGKRWEVEYRQPNPWSYKTPFRLDVNYYDLFNDNWAYPSGDEIPKLAKTVEGACYW